MNTSMMISHSIKKLDEWISKNNWRDYDPFDGLNSNVLNFFAFNNHYLRIILEQSVRRFPLNLRPILGIKKETSTKGMAYCASGYLNLYQATHKQEYLEKMKHCLGWLMSNFSNGYSGTAWGNHFHHESRGGNLPLGVPTIVWTCLIANVFFGCISISP